IEPMMGGKLLPTCVTEASEGMVVFTENPKAMANQKAVMEFLLINHPLDCPVCDQAGECGLQDYSYQFGRGHSRFQEQKVKSPKKNMGPNIYMYSDRCILCTRCVRFTDEVSETKELMIDGRGNKATIDIFPGVPLDNPLASNVVDLCPVGSLLDKDFLFAQRVWFLKKTAGIDPLTSSGDNIWIEHNQGKLHRIRPRDNMDINTWWMTDEVRYGWKFVHSEDRITAPTRREHGMMVPASWQGAYNQVLRVFKAAKEAGKKTAIVVSPMLTTEEAFGLVQMIRALDAEASLFFGPVPMQGEDQQFANPNADKPFTMRAEKAPNARGIKRVLEAFGGFKEFGTLSRNADEFGAVVLTANYSSDWVTAETAEGFKNTPMIVIDTLRTVLCDRAQVVLPSATFAEKAGSFENVDGIAQHFDQAIPTQHASKSEGQIAIDLCELANGQSLIEPAVAGSVQIVDEQPGQVPAASDAIMMVRGSLFDDAAVRVAMGEADSGLRAYAAGVRFVESDGWLNPTWRSLVSRFIEWY
ncbi:MAG: molybdopterin-dependent oxidoreductase, partial [Phycisphaerales bacterium]|nr:molybdopterin-dependent oxidoreductase [Phycisphaerales bacterium]